MHCAVSLWGQCPLLSEKLLTRTSNTKSNKSSIDYYTQDYMRRLRMFCQRGPNRRIIFFGGGGIQTPLKADHHWPTSETPFKCHLAGKLMMAQ